MKYIKTAALFLFLFIPFSQAQNEWLNNVDIYLHTVDRGTLVYDNFGHTAIRVHNKSTGSDFVYNWGIFDFADPVNFSLKFYKGILVYRLGVYPYQNALAFYQKEKRTVWEDKINFSNEEKLIFLKRLDWNNLPENRNYNYHYFFDNCSTRVRDYFNEALSGSIESSLSKESANRTFRATVREGYSTNPEIYFALDTLMNGNIDTEMNKWQEMFLPEKLRNHLLNLKADKPFFSESKTLMEFPSPKPSAMNGFQIYALIQIILIGAILFFSMKKKLKAEKAMWFFTAILTFVLGVFGLTMLLNWILSGHIDLHHNANMLLLWPTDLILLWPILALMFRKENFEVKGRKKTLWNSYINAHLALNGVFILIWITGMTQQNLSNPAIYIATVYSGLLLLIKKTYSKSEVPLAFGIN
ncbi:MAG: DUF4105 domain-containing protein [Lentisphaeraceae bacterium]|nr:DUF4105 domain-containing protein [Lentisphaeraceae bacterium]